MSSYDWTIELRFANSPDPLQIRLEGETILGRRVTADREFTGIDLTPYEAGTLGVSRRHAKLDYNGKHITITDLGSGNGTLLNNERLASGDAHLLGDGDVLWLGHLQMTVRMNTHVYGGSIVASKVDLNLENAPKMSRGQRVLIVEDDMRLSRLYQIALEKAGFTTQACRDVVSAVRLLNQNTPSLILLDLMLPGVHGLELCRYVRRDNEVPVIPMVVLSAITDEAKVQEALAVGIDVYLSKPPNISEFVSVVSALIFKYEQEHPGLGTKKLSGTTSFDAIAEAPRNDALILFVEGSREPIGVVVQSEVTLGRQAPSGSKNPHVDLDPCGAFDKGVSRVHARIKRQGDDFLIEDLNSSNGTFINGHSLVKDETFKLVNGDEVRLGTLRMHIYLLSQNSEAPSEESKPA